MTPGDIYKRILQIQQTVDVQDGEDPMEALGVAYFLATGLLEQLHQDLSKEKDR